jgi:hypothetical protein
MAYVDAATYQILGNLKIVTTGFLFWIALKRYLSRIQVRNSLYESKFRSRDSSPIV